MILFINIIVTLVKKNLKASSSDIKNALNNNSPYDSYEDDFK